MEAPKEDPRRARARMGAGLRRSPEEQAQRDRFDELYVKARSPVMRSIERGVCGCAYGGTSWTTRIEARRLGALLDLRPGLRLLEVGAGSGWSGLYLAATSGCDIALVDLPLAGLRIAAERAVEERIPGACWLAVADAADLPFRDASFDAVSHSDVLCCLRDKRGVLGACRRVIRDGARMAFSVLSIAPGLSPESHRRAIENGPEFIESELDYPTLLGQTGWAVFDRRDVTRAYAASCRRQIGADAKYRESLEDLIGIPEYAERQVGWKSKLAAIETGLLRRELFVATPSPT